MRFYLILRERCEEITKEQLPEVCLNLCGGGHNPNQVRRAILLQQQVLSGLGVWHCRDNRGRDWIIETEMEAGEETLSKPRHSWRDSACVAEDRADALVKGLQFYKAEPCANHPYCAVRDMRTSACPVCTYQAKRAKRIARLNAGE